MVTMPDDVTKTVAKALTDALDLVEKTGDNDFYLYALDAARAAVEEATARGARVTEIRIYPEGGTLQASVTARESKPIEFVTVSCEIEGGGIG